jgi:hypothetical protein
MNLNTLIGALQSKTVWLGILTLISSNIEPIRDFILAHVSGAHAATIVGLLTLVVRYFTTGSLADKAAPAAK